MSNIPTAEKVGTTKGGGKDSFLQGKISSKGNEKKPVLFSTK